MIDKLEELNNSKVMYPNPEVAKRKHQENIKHLRVLLYDEIHKCISESNEMTQLKNKIQYFIDEADVGSEVVDFDITVDLNLRVELERGKYGAFVSPEHKLIEEIIYC